MSKIAFLPFNVSESTRPALGRQISWFASELVKEQPGTEVSFGNFLVEVGTESDPRSAMANLSNDLNPTEFVWDLLKKMDGEFAVDGLVAEREGNLDVTLRVFSGPGSDPIVTKREFSTQELFESIRWILREVSSGTELNFDSAWIDGIEFGSDDAEAFKNFLIGYDAVAYVQNAGRRVANEFDFDIAFDTLIQALESDRDFLGPYEAALQLARLCAENGVGSFELIEKKLLKLLEIEPDDWRGHYTLGQIYLAGGRFDKASEVLDRAITRFDMARAKAEKEGEEPPVPEPALYNQLALAQQGLGMVVNAERNFRRAIELEGENAVSLDYLANLLGQHGRGVEVPSLYEEYTKKYPENPAFWTKYAISLAQANKPDAADQAFQDGLTHTQDSPGIKRFYASFLVQRGDTHRALDYYEDCLDANPEDSSALWEYAQALDRAERFHEVPDALVKLLAQEIPPQIRALALARKYELEQPKRMEAIQRAQESANSGNVDAAIGDLEAVVEWANDYFKAWYMLAALYNRAGRFVDAEEACKSLLMLYPGFEPGMNELVNSLIGQDKAEDAYQMLSMVVRGNSPSLLLHLRLADAAKRTGRRDEAMQLVRSIREVIGTENPGLEELLNEIERG